MRSSSVNRSPWSNLTTTETSGAGSSPDAVALAVVRCQAYQSGWYTAYRHLAGEPLDAVVFLGDDIYEFSKQKNSEALAAIDALVEIADRLRADGHVVQVRLVPGPTVETIVAQAEELDAMLARAQAQLAGDPPPVQSLRPELPDDLAAFSRQASAVSSCIISKGASE